MGIGFHAHCFIENGWYYEDGLHFLQQVGSLFNDYRGGLSGTPRTKYVGMDDSKLSSCGLTPGFFHPYLGIIELKNVTRCVLFRTECTVAKGDQLSITYGGKFSVTSQGVGVCEHHVEIDDEESKSPRVCLCVFVCLGVSFRVECEGLE